MTVRHLEVYPSEIQVEKTAANLGDAHFLPVKAQLHVTWVRPNETQSIVEGVLNKFELTAGYVKNNFDISDHYGGQNLINTQLMKLRTIGQSVLKVELFVSEHHEVLNSLLYNVYSREFMPMADAFESLLDMVDVNFEKKHQLQTIQQQVRSLGVGYAIYNANNNYEGIFNFDLRLTRDLYPLGDEVSESEPLMKKGAINGHVKLKLKLLL